MRYSLLTVLIMIILTSCGKLIDEFYLSEEMKAQIPFKGFETITFIDDSCNIYVLSGGERFNQVIKQNECINCYDYYYIENESIEFNNEFYEIGLFSEASGSSRFSIRFKIDNLTFRCSFNSPLSQDNLRENEIFYDSLIVNNKTYYHIFSDTLSHTGIIEIDPYSVRCYYSTEYGVIKIAFSDSTSWQLESIEW